VKPGVFGNFAISLEFGNPKNVEISDRNFSETFDQSFKTGGSA
jgi:hypothetical protein